MLTVRWLTCFAAIMACAITLRVQAGDAVAPLTFARQSMGSRFEVILYPSDRVTSPDDLQRAAEAAFEAIIDTDNRLSPWKLDCILTQLNENAERKPVAIPKDIFDLLAYCRSIYADSEGAFDPTVGSLVKAWGFYRGEGRIPTRKELRTILKSVDMSAVELDAQAGTVHYAKPGIRLDLGGIGKGWALDRAADILRSRGITRALLNGGTSSVVAIGAPPGESGWKIRIRDPYHAECALGEIRLSDASLSTSGSYEKFFDLQGHRYCHIFDPRTGKPVEGMLSVSVITKTGTESDALSTALFVMGEKRARAYCDKHPGVCALLAVPVGDADVTLHSLGFPQYAVTPPVK